MVKTTHRSQLDLLVTEHCSLCDQALDLLMANPMVAGWQLSTVDVIYDEELLREFGQDIPVLKCGDAILSWPFDADDLSAWLGSL